MFAITHVTRALVTLLVLLLAPPTIASAQVPSRAEVSEPGPHSPSGRIPAAPRTTEMRGALITEADLGDLELGDRPGQYRAPVRGLLITPISGQRAPLVIVAHLRYPTCADSVFAHPCPQGTELRFDRGMRYLGISLARHGYSVLIPDLGPLYIGDLLGHPYDQRSGFRRTVNRLLKATRAANEGRPSAFSRIGRGRIDTSNLGLIAHSRSAYFVRSLARAQADGPTPIKSVLVYGGAYDVAYFGERGTTAAAPDMPLLALVGTEDRDTGYAAAMWESDHIAVARRSPALVAQLPGFGHTYINRTLSAAGIDDRICDHTCATARQHRTAMKTVATRWFNATLLGGPTRFALSATDPLPRKLAGWPTLWVAASNGSHRTVYLAGKRGRLSPLGPEGSVLTCFPPEPMAPARDDQCPFPDRSVNWGASAISQVTVGVDSGVRLRTTPTAGVTGVALHLAPSDDRTDGRTGTALRVTVALADGRALTKLIRADHPAVRDRATKRRSGTYIVGTTRFSLPRWMTEGEVVSVTITGDGSRGAIDLRAIDLVTA